MGLAVADERCLLNGLEKDNSPFTSIRNYVVPSSKAAAHSLETLSPNRNTQHAKRLADVTAELKTDLNRGLCLEQVYARQAIYGPNELVESHGCGMTSNRRLSRLLRLAGSLLSKYWAQFQNPLILLLLFSAVISFFLKQYENAISIGLAVFIVGTVAFIQEYRTEKSLEVLNRLAPPRCRVIRDGFPSNRLAAELVPGDLVELQLGDRVPADLRLFTAVDLEIDESMLTGETKPFPKHADDFDFDGDAGWLRRPQFASVSLSKLTPLAEQDNLALMGTLVRQGRGRGVVIATGHGTEFGRLFALMKRTNERKSPLQYHLDRLGHQLTIYSAVIIALISVGGILIQKRALLEIFTIAVSLAVAAVPEGLPIVATITLALGVLRLSRRNVIVKSLPAVEALGSVDVVCADKTGTLTMNQLSAEQFFLVGPQRSLSRSELKLAKNRSEPEVADFLLACMLCNDSSRSAAGEWAGNATDVALMHLLDELDIPDQRSSYARANEIPFSSDRKWMAVEVRSSDTRISGSRIFMKGAPEVLMKSCKPDQRQKILDQRQKILGQHIEDFSAHGLRVLAVAAGPTMDDLQMLGLIGMIDPPREGIRETLRALQEGSVRVIMVTGDSRQTAIALATNLAWPLPHEAIMNSGRVDAVISGHELSLLLNSISTDRSESLQERITALNALSIVYRATPEHKLMLVDALQSMGHVIAMTGDGVNDAPALKMADIGIAMGRTGTDVAREAAKIILTDDNLGRLIDGMEEGKAIFSNIRHFLRFQLSTSLAALALITVSTLLNFANPPLNAMQILLINIIMDGPPAQSLGVEPVDPDVLRLPPRPKSSPILTKFLLVRTGISATIIVAGTMVVYWRETVLHGVPANESTETFCTFVLFSMFNALSCRSSTKSILHLGLFSNRFLAASLLGSLAILLAIVYVPSLNRVFQTHPLAAVDWIVMTLLGATVLAVDELIKWFFVRRRLQYQRIRQRIVDLDRRRTIV